MKKLLLSAFILCLLAFTSYEGVSQGGYGFNPEAGCVIDVNGACVPNTILTAMPFLRIAPDARGGAMGDVGISMTPDANSLYYNPSNLAFAKDKTELSLTYTPWLRQLNLNDVFLLYFSGYTKLNKVETVGAALRFFSLGDINFRDAQGNDNGTGQPRELEFLVSYARKLGDNFSAALSAKYVYSNLAADLVVNGSTINAANAFAADVSLTYRNDTKLGGYKSRWTYGLALSNLGSKVSYTDDNLVRDFLPANLGLGVGLFMEMDEYNTLAFSLELNKLLAPSPISQYNIVDGVETPNPEWDVDGNGIADYREKALFSGILGSFGDAQGGIGEEINEFALSFGAEYWYDKQFAVRAGYFYEHPEKGDRQYLTVGLGVKYNVFGINLAYLVPTNQRRNPLDNTLRFSLMFDLEGYKIQNAPSEDE